MEPYASRKPVGSKKAMMQKSAMGQKHRQLKKIDYLYKKAPWNTFLDAVFGKYTKACSL